MLTISIADCQEVYYTNETTRNFSEECPLISVDIIENDDVITIAGKVGANITNTGDLTVYIGGLPSENYLIKWCMSHCPNRR